MNPPSSPDESLPAGERFIDAVLSEHARLGNTASDSELVHRILLETVHRRPLAVIKETAKRSPAWQTWLSGAAAVAALIAVAVIGLSNAATGRGVRPSEELQFTVRFLDTTAPPAGQNAGVEAPELPAKAFAGPVTLTPPTAVAGSSPALTPGNYELITSLGPSFEKLPATASRSENFRITADRSLASADRRLYEGNVIVEHVLYRIEASEVTVPLPGRARANGESPLLAAKVKVTQLAPYRVAHAESLQFDPLSGAMVLSGIESFETVGGKLARFAPGDQLVLTGDNFSVESAAIQKYASPLPVTR